MDLAAVKTNRQLWRECICPTHTAVRELVAYAETLEALCDDAAIALRSSLKSFTDPTHFSSHREVNLVSRLERRDTLT